MLDWQEEGLQKESTVRLSQPLKLLPDDFIDKIGDVSIFDVAGIQDLMAFYKFI